MTHELKFGETLVFRVAVLAVLCISPHVQAQTATPAADDTPFKTYVRSANAARDAGKIDLAVRDYQEALKLDPHWQEGWWNVGTLEYERDDYAEAIPAFRTLAGLAPQASPAWTFLGLCEFETKDYANALEHLAKGQTLGDQDDPEIARVAKYHLALLLIRNAEFEKANAPLDALTNAGPASPQIKFALGLRLLRVPLLPEEVDPSREALAQEAGEIGVLLAEGNSEAALAAFRAAITKFPDTPYLHYAYGGALAERGNLPEALAEFRREAAISATALPYVEIARVEIRLRHPKEALLAAEEAVRAGSDSRAAHESLAQCFAELGEKQRSNSELAMARKLDTEKPRSEERIVQRYRRASGERDVTQSGVVPGDELWTSAMRDYSAGKYSDSISTLKLWLRQNPRSGTGWAVLGLNEFALRDFDNALIHLQRGQQLGMSGSPESVQLAKYRLAVLLNHQAQFNNAEEVLTSISSAGLPTREITFALGMALLHLREFPDEVDENKRALVKAAGEVASLLRNSRYDLAFSKLDELLKKYPATPFLHYTNGTALASLSQFDEAAEQFREEAVLSPSSELPYLGIASLELKRHRPADAVEPARRALRLAPRNATAHYLLGRSYLETGEEKPAIGELEQASAMTPGSPEVHFILAKAYARANRPEKAEEERAIFAQLNAQAEQQRGHQGNQSYGVHDAGKAGISSVDHAPADDANPR